MAAIDRREFLRRAGSAALAIGAAPAGLELVRPGDAAGGSDARLRKLARELKGPVYERGSGGYSRTRKVFNRRYADVAPLAVAQPETVADVQECVRWAQRYGVRLVPRSGGHSYAGYSTGKGVLQVDLRRMAGVRVEAGSATAVVGAGAPLMQVYAGLAARGVTVPAGSCPTVGVAGLALGGGHGLASRRFGLTSDNIAEVGIVLADGRHVTADASQNADLLWACRGGGGGNFGIVTHLRFRVHRVERATRFSISWPWSQAAAVLAAWQSWAPDAPDGLDSILNLSTGARSPTVRCVGQYFGGAGTLRGLLRPVTRVGSPSVSMRTQGYLDVQKWLAGCAGESVGRCVAYSPQYFAAKSHYIRRAIPSGGRAIVVREVERAQRLPGGGALILDAYGGAINRVPADATAFVHRGERVSAQFFTSWGTPRAAGSMVGWLRRFHAAMRPHASGFAYQNYIDPDLKDWKRAYYGSNLDELVAVKAAYDPDRFFRFHQGISPG
jgi:FAD/FMN-containing dehydrogenase